MEDPTETVPLHGGQPWPGSSHGAEALERGAAVGRYVVLDRIGAGGMGVVYAAWDPELERRIALKLLRPERFGSEPDRLRLLREAQALARLTHPNVVAVHDAGTFGDRVFVAMELVEGRTLRQWLAEGSWSWRQILETFLAAGRGLAAAHAAGLIHRDFKPGNVLIGTDGRIRVADFGLAREPGEPAAEWGLAEGTPGYMAPEQRRGEPADARSDQFSFCVSLYEALYGERPFAGENPREVAEAVLHGEVRPEPAGTRVPGGLRQTLLRGLKARPEDRHPSMDALLSDLERDPGAVRRRWLAAAAVVLVAGAVFTSLGYFQARRAQLCGGSGEKLEKVWNPERKQKIRAAFLATRLPFAEEAWKAAEQRIDRYGRSWIGLRREACEDTRARGEQSAALLDRRMLCFDQRLQRLDALAGLLERVGAAGVRQAGGSLDVLEDLADCAGSAPLLDKTPPPRDPALRARLTAVQAKVEKARVLQSAGQIRPALDLALAADREAAGIPYPPLQGDAAFLVGDLRENAGQIQEAERDVYRALAIAESGRDDLLKAQCWKKLIYIVGYRQSRFEEAHRLARLAEAALARAGGSPRWEAAILDGEAAVYRMETKNAEALRTFERVLALSEKHHVTDLYTTFSNIGGTYQEIGDYGRALDYYRRAFLQVRSLKGDFHPETASLEFNLGTVLMALKRYPEAESYFQRALAKREKILGPDHVDTAESLVGLGVLWDRLGHPEKSLPYQERALAIYARRLPGSLPWLSTVNNVGEALRQTGRYEEAEKRLREGVGVFEARFGDENLYLSYMLDSLGKVYLDAGRAREAVPVLERAEALLKKQGPSEDLADTQFALARALWDAGRHERAVSVARESLKSYGRAGDTFREDAGQVERWLSRLGIVERKPLA
jgi:tetratricopeptide (TPR) repeat protein